MILSLRDTNRTSSLTSGDCSLSTRARKRRILQGDKGLCVKLLYFLEVMSIKYRVYFPMRAIKIASWMIHLQVFRKLVQRPATS